VGIGNMVFAFLNITFLVLRKIFPEPEKFFSPARNYFRLQKDLF
jgi:hypothetical protein